MGRISTEAWTKLQSVLKDNADYQYLLNYKFEYLHKAKEPNVQPSFLWELFDKNSEWELLDYLSSKNWFIPGDWHNIIVDDDNADVVVDRLIKYFTAICRYEMIAKVASTHNFYNEKVPGKVDSIRPFDRAVFFERDFVLCFKSSPSDNRGDNTPGIWFSLLGENFDGVKFGPIDVDLTVQDSYVRISVNLLESAVIHNIKMKTIQDKINVWNRLVR